jgi:hypothetical protein
MKQEIAKALGFWTGHPFPEQIEKSLEDAGFVIVPRGLTEELRNELKTQLEAIEENPVAGGDFHEWDLARRSRIRSLLARAAP